MPLTVGGMQCGTLHHRPVQGGIKRTGKQVMPACDFCAHNNPESHPTPPVVRPTQHGGTFRGRLEVRFHSDAPRIRKEIFSGVCFSFTGWVETFNTQSKKAMEVCSVQFSCSVMSNSLRPHESQHARPPCRSPTPGAYSNSCHRVSDAIQPSHPLSSPSPPAPNPSQHQGLFQ